MVLGGDSRRTSLKKAIGANAGLGLAAPAVSFFILFILGPIIATIAISLTNWQLGRADTHFVGLDNFRSLFVDPVVRASIRNSSIYTAIVVTGSVILGFGLAMLIETQRSLRTFYQAMHFLPFMAMLTAMSVAWEALLHPTAGLVNRVLVELKLPTANWLADERTALITLAVIGVWQNLGFAIVLFAAGLRGIPPELYEAAAIDGINHTLDRVRYITLPSLLPVALFVSIAVSLRAAETFDTVRVLTQGGPSNATQLIMHGIYTETFEFLNVGRGAAIALLYIVSVGSLALLQFIAIGRREQSA